MHIADKIVVPESIK